MLWWPLETACCEHGIVLFKSWYLSSISDFAPTVCVPANHCSVSFINKKAVRMYSTKSSLNIYKLFSLWQYLLYIVCTGLCTHSHGCKIFCIWTHLRTVVFTCLDLSTAVCFSSELSPVCPSSSRRSVCFLIRATLH